MSQIKTENDDNHSVAASDFLQFHQADEVPNQEEQQQDGQQQFGLHQNPLDWTMNTGSTHNYGNELKEHKLMITNLEEKFQGALANLQGKLEILELKTENRALKENAEQKTNNQALNELKDEFAKMLSTQNEQHQEQMEQLAAKNRKLEEKLNAVELQTTENGALNGKMEQLKNEFAKMLSDKMAELRTEMEEIGKRAMDGNQLKLDYIWSQLMTKSKLLANPKGIVWNGLTSEASISECELKATNSCSDHKEWVFATEGYAISGEQCRTDNFHFPGTIVFYYEVTATFGRKTNFSVGFTDGSKTARRVGDSPNSYGIVKTYGNKGYCWLAGKEKEHKLECPIGAIDSGDVFGCGILLNSKNELAVFFTLNGTLIGKQTAINPTVDRLYPTVSIYRTSVEANFGDNLVDKPFKFDSDKCPGLVFE